MSELFRCFREPCPEVLCVVPPPLVAPAKLILLALFLIPDIVSVALFFVPGLVLRALFFVPGLVLITLFTNFLQLRPSVMQSDSSGANRRQGGKCCGEGLASTPPKSLPLEYE